MILSDSCNALAISRIDKQRVKHEGQRKFIITFRKGILDSNSEPYPLNPNKLEKIVHRMVRQAHHLVKY